MEKELEKNLNTELETVEAPKKPSLLKRLRNHRGFSLVEMAIVLVIIGIIIAAIVKGQDLILNANAKKVTAAVSTWRNLALAFLDRNGRLPGDGNRDGLIGNPATPVDETVLAGSANTELSGTMYNAPANPIVVGGMSFYVYFGRVPGVGGTFRNAIFVCKAAGCNTAFTADEVEIIKSMDTAFDGFADAGKGQFRSGALAVSGSPATSNVITTVPSFVNHSSAGNTSTPWSTSDNYAVWAFERPF